MTIRQLQSWAAFLAFMRPISGTIYLHLQLKGVSLFGCRFFVKVKDKYKGPHISYVKYVGPLIFSELLKI
jgi:hypothetical protein